MLWVTLIASAIFFGLTFSEFGDGSKMVLSGNETIWTGFLSYLLIRGVGLAVLLPGRLRKKTELSFNLPTI